MMAREERTTAGPPAAPPVVGREDFDHALADQVRREKGLTHLGDMVSAARRRLPMTPIEDYEFTGPEGPVRLTELFGEHRLLLVQNVMFDPAWEDGCPSCAYATDSLPARMSLLDEAGIAFAMIARAPIAKIEAWREKRGWPHRWVSSGETSYDEDWGWTVRSEDGGYSGPQPGWSFHLLHEGTPYLTYLTRQRGTEALVVLAAIQDRTVFGRQQDWEDSPAGWPQRPTYG